MSEIRLYKLISGEEVIGTVKNSNEIFVELADTVTVTYHPAGDGKMTAGFAPHMPYAEGNITLNHTAIAFVAGVKEDMESEYKRIFSPIITPPRGLAR
jgi:hypothetical protein